MEQLIMENSNREDIKIWDILKLRIKFCVIEGLKTINRILHGNVNHFTKNLLITRITVTSYSVEISNEDYTKSCTYRYEIRFTLPRGIYLRINIILRYLGYRTIDGYKISNPRVHR